MTVSIEAPWSRPESVGRAALDIGDPALLARVDDVASLLKEGTYLPSPVTPFWIPSRPGRRARLVHAVGGTDRLVERTALNALQPQVDRELSESAHAYRPGRGTRTALERLRDALGTKAVWVVRADIKACFSSISAELAMASLREIVSDPELVELVQSILNSRAAAGHGLCEGTSLAPLLANVVLSKVDHAMSDRGFTVVRYGDDFAIPAPDRSTARLALQQLGEELSRVGLSLSPDKSEVMEIGSGFAFLGELVTPVDRPTEVDVGRRRLYVGHQGARVRLSRGRVVVESRDAAFLDIPMSQVGALVCFGSVGVSAGFRSWALRSGVDVVFLTRRGGPLGVLVPHSAARGRRLIAQAQVSTDRGRRAEIARGIIDAKLRNQMVLLRRHNRRGPHDAARDGVATIAAIRAGLDRHRTIHALMGAEGSGAKAYFTALAALLPADLGFTGRRRRPAPDVVNAALSYGYAILLSEAHAAVLSAGLEPSLGLLHETSGKRPGLALDLMEEFRPYVVDQIVVTLAKQRALDGAGTPRADGSFELSKRTISMLVDAHERRMLTPAHHAVSGQHGSIRRMLYAQANRLGRAIGDRRLRYEGLSWR